MNHRIARRRLGAVYATRDNIIYLQRLGQQAREAEAAERIEELLGPAGLEYARTLMGAEVLAALAGVS